MDNQQVIILEEPPHPYFSRMLASKLSIDEYLMEIEHGYPVFASMQYEYLRSLAANGVDIIPIEPYLEKLYQVQLMFAEGMGPDQLDQDTLLFEVYQVEKQATGRLIDYYQSVRQDDFQKILDAIQLFAKADGDRFLLRDSLRADAISTRVDTSRTVSIEAGSMHISLKNELRKKLPKETDLIAHNVEETILAQLGLEPLVFSPGDELTAIYMAGDKIDSPRENRLSAQSLLYAKVVRKEEIAESAERYPHTRNEYETNLLVRQFDTDQCNDIFFQLRDLPTQEACQQVQHMYKQ